MLLWGKGVHRTTLNPTQPNSIQLNSTGPGWTGPDWTGPNATQCISGSTSDVQFQSS